MTFRFALLLPAVLACSTSAYAQSERLVGIAREARSFQNEARTIQLDRRTDRAARRAEEKKETTYAISIGASYTRLQEAGHTWATPFALSATVPNGTTFKISGDGYSHTSLPGGSEGGLADVELLAARKFFADSKLPLKLGVGAKIGSGGDAGTDTHALFVSAGYRKEMPIAGGAKQGFGASAKVRRDVHNTPAGVDPWFVSGSLTYDYTLAEKAGNLISGWSAQIGRAKRIDGPGASFAVLSFQRPVTKDWDADFSIYRGLTKGARDTALEISVGREF